MQELMQELQMLTGPLTTLPDDYTFKRRPMKVINPSISRGVMCHQGMAEASSIKLLVKMVVDQEATLTAQKHFEEVKLSGSRESCHAQKKSWAEATLTLLVKCWHDDQQQPPKMQSALIWLHQCCQNMGYDPGQQCDQVMGVTTQSMRDEMKR